MELTCSSTTLPTPQPTTTNSLPHLIPLKPHILQLNPLQPISLLHLAMKPNCLLKKSSQVTFQ